MTCSAKAKIQNFRSWTNVFDKMPTMIPYQSCALQIGDGKVLHSLQDRTHLGLLYDMGASRLCCNRQTAPNLEKSYLCCVPLHQSLLKHFWRQRGFWRYGVDPDNRSMQGSLWKTTEHRQGSTKGKNISVKLCHAIGGPEAFSERMLNVIIDRKSANDYALMETESVVEECKWIWMPFAIFRICIDQWKNCWVWQIKCYPIHLKISKSTTEATRLHPFIQ